MKNKTTIKIFILTSILLVMFCVPIFNAKATDEGGGTLNLGRTVTEVEQGMGIKKPGEGMSVPEIVAAVIRMFLLLLGVLFVCLIVYAGYLYLTAGGEPEKAKKARDYIKNAVIGILLTTMAYAITDFVLDRLIGEKARETEAEIMEIDRAQEEAEKSQEEYRQDVWNFW